MATPTSKAELISYCKRQLGAPVVEINVDADQADDIMDDAIQFYNEYHYDGSIRTYLKHQITQTEIDNQKTKKLRLLIQDIISHQQRVVSGKLGIWSVLYPVKKIVYISFKFSCFYNSDTSKNIFKIVIPLDIFNYFFGKHLLFLTAFFLTKV